MEDWFQVENFKDYIPFSSWATRELRVEKNTMNLLNLLDSTPFPVHATFFVLGWIAERCPDLVREIQIRGHEVASHGYNHDLCYAQSADNLHEDLLRSKDLLETIIGNQVYGYRAPSFSITDDAIDLIQKAGYIYDSSYNSYDRHGRYGSLTLPENSIADAAIYQLDTSFFEIPVSNLRIASRVIPWGGGGYFRLMPSLLHKLGVKYILEKNNCYTFYMHPWEIDFRQPRMKEAKSFFRFRHYVNLQKTEKKLERFIAFNSEHIFCTCHNFVTKHE